MSIKQGRPRKPIGGLRQEHLRQLWRECAARKVFKKKHPDMCIGCSQIKDCPKTQILLFCLFEKRGNV